MNHSRAKIRLNTMTEVNAFLKAVHLASAYEESVFYLEDFDGSRRVDANSYLGVIYASGEWQGEIYIVNTTHDGKFLAWLDPFRA